MFAWKLLILSSPIKGTLYFQNQELRLKSWKFSCVVEIDSYSEVEATTLFLEFFYVPCHRFPIRLSEISRLYNLDITFCFRFRQSARTHARPSEFC